MLQKQLADRCRAAGLTVEWADLLRDLDRLQEATIDKDGKRITTRTARHRPGRPRLPGHRHRAATQHPRTRNLTSRPRNVVLTTGPAGVTSCHNTIFFTPLFKLG